MCGRLENMISFWHLSAVCCIPLPNPSARLREREIFRLVPSQFRESVARRGKEAAKKSAFSQPQPAR